jgi:hypothetical protein
MRTNSPSEFVEKELNPFFAAELLFDSGATRFWNGYGELTFDGKTFFGGGSLLSVSDVEEISDIEAKGLSFILSGLPSELISIVLQEPYQNRVARLFIGALKDDGTVQAYELFSGRLDVMTIEESGETASIAITVENRLIDLNRPRVRRYTSEDQKSLFSGDRGFDYVNDLQDKEIEWGKTS